MNRRDFLAEVLVSAGLLTTAPLFSKLLNLWAPAPKRIVVSEWKPPVSFHGYMVGDRIGFLSPSGEWVNLVVSWVEAQRAGGAL